MRVNRATPCSSGHPHLLCSKRYQCLMISGTTIGGRSDPGLPVTGVRVGIADNDTAPTAIVLSLDKDRISESAGLESLTVTATLQGGGARTVETAVTLTTSHQTTSDSDYSSLPVELSIEPSELAGTATLVPVDDSIDEGDETLTVMAATAGPGFRALHEKVVTITDEAGATASPDTMNVHEGRSASYTVVLDTQPTADVTVTISVQDGTYRPPSCLYLAPNDLRPKTPLITPLRHRISLLSRPHRDPISPPAHASNASTGRDSWTRPTPCLSTLPVPSAPDAR